MIVTTVTDTSRAEVSSSAPQRVRRRWGAWATIGWFVLAFAVAAIVVLAGESLVEKLGKGEGEVSSIAIDYAAKFSMVGVFVLAAYWSRQPVADYLGFVYPRTGRTGEIVMVGLATLAAPFLIYFVIGNALGLSTHWPRSGGLLPTAFLGWIAGGFGAPFTEELTFRGFLYRGFAQSRLGAVGAIVFTAALFTVAHFPEFVGTADWYLDVSRIATVGLLFGWLRERTGSVLPGLAIHVLINAVEAPVIYHVMVWR
jgi:membrane protease YdiL (CAAX protease family)